MSARPHGDSGQGWHVSVEIDQRSAIVVYAWNDSKNGAEQVVQRLFNELGLGSRFVVTDATPEWD